LPGIPEARRRRVHDGGELRAKAACSTTSEVPGVLDPSFDPTGRRHLDVRGANLDGD